ncbi:protein DPCD-like isoform X2 [Gigantopelta aegis]|uniref:protein DPCD-like isoform X2 n=1 Tax=Gigantopelta aegis TaxID=1735272 RepID=UPI001B88D21B|nr:protein DPCD-like isoform X2 [Gigantopelta aegis]
MASAWLEKLKSSHKTCIIQDGRRKIHFTFSDGTELAEEYNLSDNELIIRKWKRKGTLGGEGKWDFEVGDQSLRQQLAEGLMESSSNPVFTRKDKKSDFEWRIRNLPYPIETYSVTVDDDNKHIIVRTSNKKYYKKFSIPDMDRAQLPISQKWVQYAHANNTLIISVSLVIVWSC